VKTPKYFIENWIYNFGDIYMNFRNFLIFLFSNARGNEEVAYDSGYSLGLAVYYAVQPYQDSIWWKSGLGT
jgi:hypothetical protein